MTVEVDDYSVPKALAAALAGLVVNLWVFDYFPPPDAIPAAQKMADLWRHTQGPLAAGLVMWLLTSVKRKVD